LQRLANAAATPARACSIILLIAGGRFALQADEIKTAVEPSARGASGVVIRSVANPITTTAIVVYVSPPHQAAPTPSLYTTNRHLVGVHAYSIAARRYERIHKMYIIYNYYIEVYR